MWRNTNAISKQPSLQLEEGEGEAQLIRPPRRAQKVRKFPSRVRSCCCAMDSPSGAPLCTTTSPSSPESAAGPTPSSPTAEDPPISYAIRPWSGLREPPSLLLFALAALRTAHPKHWPSMVRQATGRSSEELGAALAQCWRCRRWTALGTHGRPRASSHHWAQLDIVDAENVVDTCARLSERVCLACWEAAWFSESSVVTFYTAGCADVRRARLADARLLLFAGGTGVWTFGASGAPYVCTRITFIKRPRHHPAPRARKRPRGAPAAARVRAPQTSLALRKL